MASKKISLSNGFVTIVDEEDFDFLSRWRWSYRKSYNCEYAFRNKYMGCVDGKRKNKLIHMHRMIINVPENMSVDHINGDGLDNRRCNLRVCSRAENSRNQKKQIRKTASKYKGVTWNKRDKKWKAQIKTNKKNYYLGQFLLEKEAALVYNKAAKIRFGEFARLNIL